MITIAPRFTVTQDGATINIYHADAGEGLPAHSHEYSHLTMCFAGRCMVRNPRKALEIDKNTQPINLLAGEWHEIEALDDGTVFVNVFFTSHAVG